MFQMQRMTWVLGLLVICSLLLLPETAWASGTNPIKELSGGVERVQATISGPILKSVAIIALVVGGLMLAFGGELNSTAKTMAQVFLAIGLAGGATSIVTKVFSISGATTAGVSRPVTAEPIEWLAILSLSASALLSSWLPWSGYGLRSDRLLRVVGLAAGATSILMRMFHQVAVPGDGIGSALDMLALVVLCSGALLTGVRGRFEWFARGMAQLCLVVGLGTALSSMVTKLVGVEEAALQLPRVQLVVQAEPSGATDDVAE